MKVLKGISLASLVILAILAAITLGGCATPPTISGTTAGALPIPITTPVAVKDLKSAASNLDQAVAVGALSKDDPAPACVHDVLQKAGIEPIPGVAAPQSFTPVNDGPASLGAILYIEVQQAKALAGKGITVSQPCLALIGQIHLDAMTAAAKGLRAGIGLR